MYVKINYKGKKKSKSGNKLPIRTIKVSKEGKNQFFLIHWKACISYYQTGETGEVHAK